MATLYVSNSTANGYAVGNDSNTRTQIQSKATPSLSVTHAWTVAQSGDTIVVNDGTYLEAAFVSVGTPITLIGETNYGATIQCSGAAARVIHILAAASGTVIGKVVIDARGVQTGCLSTDSTNPVASLTIHGTHLVNSTGSVFSSVAHLRSLTMDQGWLAQPAANAAAGMTLTSSETTVAYSLDAGTVITSGTTATGILINPNSGSTVTAVLSNNTITVASSSAAPGAISAAPQAGGTLNITLSGNTVTVSSTSTTAQIHAVSCTNCAQVTLSGNTISIANLVATQINYGIYVPSASSPNPTRCFVQNNTIDMADTGRVTTSIAVQIGSNLDTLPSEGRDVITGIVVAQNTIRNSNHAILIGWQSNHFCWGNYIDNCVLGLVDKHCGGAGAGLWSGNILTRMDSASTALRFKGSSAGIMANNLHIITSGFAGWTCLANTASSGVEFRSNLLYVDAAATPAVLAEVQDTSTATFRSNNYYWAGGALPATAFGWQGSYVSFASWQAAHETTAHNVDPMFAGYAGGDYRVLPTSTLFHAGASTANATEYRGRPFGAIPTIGAYEVTSGDAAVARAARAAPQ